MFDNVHVPSAPLPGEDIFAEIDSFDFSFSAHLESVCLTAPLVPALADVPIPHVPRSWLGVSGMATVAAMRGVVPAVPPPATPPRRITGKGGVESVEKDRMYSNREESFIFNSFLKKARKNQNQNYLCFEHPAPMIKIISF